MRDSLRHGDSELGRISITGDIVRIKLKTALDFSLALITVAAVGTGHARGADHKPRDGTLLEAEKSDAQTGFVLEPWSVDVGGGEAGGGTFAIVAALGQPDAGLANACGRVFDGGVWSASVDLRPVFCDGFEVGGTGNWANVIPIAEPTDDSQTPGGE